MALPSSGAISLADVRAELNLTGEISLGQGAVRSLAGIASGAISLSDLRGKSAALIVYSATFSDGRTNFRGYSRGHDGLGIGPSVAGGSISATTYQGVIIQAIGTWGTTANKLFIYTLNADKPTPTKVSINGETPITISWVSRKLTYEAEISRSGMYATAASNFTVVFS